MKIYITLNVSKELNEILGNIKIFTYSILETTHIRLKKYPCKNYSLKENNRRNAKKPNPVVARKNFYNHRRNPKGVTHFVQPPHQILSLLRFLFITLVQRYLKLDL